MKKYLIIALSLGLVFVLACKQNDSKSVQKQASHKAEANHTKSKSGDKSEELVENWIGVEELVGDSEPISYKQDKSFKGTKYKDVIYLASFPNGNVCALNKDRSVLTMSGDGTELYRFNPDLKGRVSAIAIDENNLIHVLSSQQKELSHKVRGRSVTRMVSTGVICTTFDSKGKQVKQIKLDTLKSASGARVVGDRLIVSDAESKRVAILHKDSGKTIAVMDGMRQCGGVLDISVSQNNEILIGNLGAFRVELFDFDGKRLGSFGERGKDLKNFHGCCNPVSLTNLSNGAVVSVEKFPTRIKVYSKQGVQELPEIEQLNNCKYMPFTSDTHNNLYIGASEKGLVKCVPLK